MAARNRSSDRASPKCMKRPPLHVPYAVRVTSILHAHPLKLRLQFLLKSLKVGGRRSISWFLRHKSQATKLIQVPFRTLAVAKRDLAADQGSRSCEAINPYGYP